MPDIITNKLQNSTVQDVIATKLARAVFAGFEAMFATFLNITLSDIQINETF